MNEQERSRLIERIAENHLNKSERADLLRQLESGSSVQQEVMAEQAISRAIARDRQQLPASSITPSPRLLEALSKSNIPASLPATAQFWGSSGFFVGVLLVVVVGIGFLLFPGLFALSGDVVPASTQAPAAVVTDTSSIAPAVTISGSSESSGEKKKGKSQPTPAAKKEAVGEGRYLGNQPHPALDAKPTQPVEPQGQRPPIPVVHDNNGTIPVIPK
ncbi:MAG: hypothetical protein IT211_14210 [Armatimonadetes bacterium]|nr:hypothetical protein [Armatimonadota bacterium]